MYTFYFKTIGSMYGKKYLHEWVFLVTVGNYTRYPVPWIRHGKDHII